MIWPAFPKRLLSALKALCSLAQTDRGMHSAEIAARIQVPAAETAKVLQLLVWGGFVSSRRGSKGGFQLASKSNQITMGKVIDFFLSKHPPAPDRDLAVMRVFEKTSAPCQEAFAKLTLADVVNMGASSSKQRARPRRGNEFVARSTSRE